MALVGFEAQIRIDVDKAYFFSRLNELIGPSWLQTFDENIFWLESFSLISRMHLTTSKCRAEIHQAFKFLLNWKCIFYVYSFFTHCKMLRKHEIVLINDRRYGLDFNYMHDLESSFNPPTTLIFNLFQRF